MVEIADQFDTYEVTASPAGAGETVIATLTNVSTRLPGQSVRLHGWTNITPAAAATGIILRVRRGGVTGDQVGGHPAVTFVATVWAGGISLDIDVEDQPGQIEGASYVLTAVCTAGATTSTVNLVHLGALVA